MNKNKSTANPLFEDDNFEEFQDIFGCEPSSESPTSAGLIVSVSPSQDLKIPLLSNPEDDRCNLAMDGI
jgi:hypothetical protein